MVVLVVKLPLVVTAAGNIQLYKPTTTTATHNDVLIFVLEGG
jgi:hypothetical protein